MPSNLVAMASNLVAMASNLVAMASNILAMASNLVAMASNILAMASNPKAKASNLVGMASNLNDRAAFHLPLSCTRLCTQRITTNWKTTCAQTAELKALEDEEYKPATNFSGGCVRFLVTPWNGVHLLICDRSSQHSQHQLIKLHPTFRGFEWWAPPATPVKSEGCVL